MATTTPCLDLPIIYLLGYVPDLGWQSGIQLYIAIQIHLRQDLFLACCLHACPSFTPCTFDQIFLAVSQMLFLHLRCLSCLLVCVLVHISWLRECSSNVV